mmetsp:Transcript_39299/g.104146  ORF Transcript_39299/g.104146 Transcript_39299/m.104146 type:complete len:260 (-) Transcript_39299:500-1279(-)
MLFWDLTVHSLRAIRGRKMQAANWVIRKCLRLHRKDHSDRGDTWAVQGDVGNASQGHAGIWRLLRRLPRCKGHPPGVRAGGAAVERRGRRRRGLLLVVFHLSPRHGQVRRASCPRRIVTKALRHRCTRALPPPRSRIFLSGHRPLPHTCCSGQCRHLPRLRVVPFLDGGVDASHPGAPTFGGHCRFDSMIANAFNWFSRPTGRVRWTPTRRRACASCGFCAGKYQISFSRSTFDVPLRPEGVPRHQARELGPRSRVDDL